MASSVLCLCSAGKVLPTYCFSGENCLRSKVYRVKLPWSANKRGSKVPDFVMMLLLMAATALPYLLLLAHEIRDP